MRWIKLAYKNVLRNRRRALVTILISTLGVTGILVSGGFANFTYVSLKEMAARSSGHLIAGHAKYFDQEEEVPMEFGLSDYQAVAAAIKRDPDVRYVIPRINFSGLISNGDKSTIFMGSGVDVKYEFKVKGPFLRVEKGSTLSRRETVDDPKVMLGVGLAASLKAEPGDILTLLGTTVEGGLNGIDVTVQGVFSTGTPEIDKRAIIVSLSTAQSLLETEKISSLAIHLRDTEASFRKFDELSAQYNSLAWQTWLDSAHFYTGVKNLYNRIFGLLGSIIIIMVFFAIYNTVNTSIIERTREIGALRAMGTYSSEIVRNFVGEGGIIGGFGALLGCILASLISLFLLFANIQMPPPPGRTTGYPLVIDIPAELYVSTALMSIFVCVLAAWLSSRRMAKKSIVGALSHV